MPEDTPAELAYIIQSCWVEDPNMRPSFSQIIRMLNEFLFTLKPSSPTSSETNPSEAELTKNGAIIEFSSRAKGKFAFLRQLFATKKALNSQLKGDFDLVFLLGMHDYWEKFLEVIGALPLLGNSDETLFDRKTRMFGKFIEKKNSLFHGRNLCKSIYRHYLILESFLSLFFFFFIENPCNITSQSHCIKFYHALLILKLLKVGCAYGRFGFKSFKI